MYHLTLTENQTRIRALLQHLSQARRDPRRWLRLGDVESVLERTNDPESYRSLLLASTHLEDIIESDTSINYPLWSAMRLPYVITNGPGRKCTAAEMVDAPVWNNELNWMDVLGHLSKLIPAVRECVTGGKLDRVERINARLTTELTPLLFEMNAVAPVLVGEVERLLNTGFEESESNATTSAQQEISQAEVAQPESQQITQQAAESISAETTSTESGTQKNRVARKTASTKAAPAPKVGAAKKSGVAKTVTAAKKKTAATKKATPSSKSAPKRKKAATAESERRALAVGIADADAANDQYAHQLALPLFA